jgi:hypothetical protein
MRGNNEIETQRRRWTFYETITSFRAHFTNGGIFCKGKNTTKCIFAFFVHNMLWIAGEMVIS